MPSSPSSSLLAFSLLLSVCLGAVVSGAPLHLSEPATEADAFPSETITKIYPVTSLKVTALDPHTNAHKSVWDLATAPPSPQHRRSPSAAAPPAIPPHQHFPSDIFLEFTAPGKPPQSIKASLLHHFYDHDSAAVIERATSTLDGAETVTYHTPVLRAYHGKTSAGAPVSVVLHDTEGSLHMVVFDPDGHFTIEPLDRHEAGMHESHRRSLREASAATGLVLFHGKDVADTDSEEEEGLIGSRSLPLDLDSGLGGDSAANKSAPHQRARIPKSVVLPLAAHSASPSRRAVAQWLNCFPNGNSQTYSTTAAFAVDVGYYRAVGSTIPNVQVSVSEIMAAANIVYLAQMNVFIMTGILDIRTTLDSTAWNQLPSTMGTRSCAASIDSTLDALQTWRYARSATETISLWHLLTHCYPAPGTIGLATVGALCNAAWGAGVSSRTSQTWLTVAHEIGHNFNAQHTFGNGGVMDYGDGKYLGEYQFYSPSNQAQICPHITSSMSDTYLRGFSNVRKVPNCWQPYTPTCGNGVVEDGEQCDDSSSCCSNCRLTAGSECSNNPSCCVSCKFALPSQGCSNGLGFCANGKCIVSGCNQFSNVKHCGVSSTNPCLLSCQFDGSTTCTLATSISSLTTKYVPVGTVCARSPYSQCAASGSTTVCNPTSGGAEGEVAFSWFSSEWSICVGTCNFGAQQRSVTCIGTDGLTYPDERCVNAGTKPSNSRTCVLTACSWSAPAWSTVSCVGSCGSTTQIRTVTCKTNGGTGMTVSAAFCSDFPKPDETQPCTLASCSSGGFRWSAGAFGVCTGNCGVGIQSRTITCVSTSASTAVVDDAFCLAISAKPATSQPCALNTCTQPVDCTCDTWSDFHPCSVSCGGGTQYRDRICQEGRNGGRTCAQLGLSSRMYQVCNTQPCPIDCDCTPWSYTACSATCGGGTLTRQRSCLEGSYGGKTCKEMGLVSTEVLACNTGACPTPDKTDCTCGPYGAPTTCSRSCGGGVVIRQRTCTEATSGGQSCAALGLSTVLRTPCNAHLCTLSTSWLLAYFRFDSGGSSSEGGMVSSWFTVGANSRSSRRDVLLDRNSIAANAGSQTPVFVPGLSGSALSFDGSQRADVFATTDDDTRKVLFQYTVSLWINPSLRSSGTPIFTMVGLDGAIEFRTNPSNSLVVPAFRFGTNRFVYGSAATVGTVGVWTHLALTQVSGLYSFYINGSLVSTLNATFPESGMDLPIARLGCDIGVAAGSCFVGKMDEFALYSGAHSAVEIDEMYSRGSSRDSLARDAVDSGAGSGSSGAVVGAVVAVLLIAVICVVLFVLRRRGHGSSGRGLSSVKLFGTQSQAESVAMEDNHMAPSKPTPARSTPPSSVPSASKRAPKMTAAAYVAALKGSRQALEQYRAVYSYTPQQPDELQVQADDIVSVLQKNPDGWYYCKSARTHQSGVLPSNYLEKIATPPPKPPHQKPAPSSSSAAGASGAPSATAAKSTAHPKTTSPVSPSASLQRSASPPPAGPAPAPRPAELRPVSPTPSKPLSAAPKPTASASAVQKPAPQRPVPAQKK